MLPLLKGLGSLETFKCLALKCLVFSLFFQYIVSTYSVKEMLVDVWERHMSRKMWSLVMWYLQSQQDRELAREHKKERFIPNRSLQIPTKCHEEHGDQKAFDKLSLGI